MSGFEATPLIRDRFPQVTVVLMSVSEDTEYTRLAEEVGTVAFITKMDFSAGTLDLAFKARNEDT